MPSYESLGLLPPELARAADEVIETMINVAAREVTATGCPLITAMRHCWGNLAAQTPEVWGLAVIRLSQTGNEEMLLYATLEDGQ